MKIKKVKTDYEGCEYITAGKEYDVVSKYDDLVRIEDDDGSLILIRLGENVCAHLELEGSWEWLD